MRGFVQRPYLALGEVMTRREKWATVLAISSILGLAFAVTAQITLNLIPLLAAIIFWLSGMYAIYRYGMEPHPNDLNENT